MLVHLLTIPAFDTTSHEYLTVAQREKMTQSDPILDFQHFKTGIEGIVKVYVDDSKAECHKNKAQYFAQIRDSAERVGRCTYGLCDDPNHYIFRNADSSTIIIERLKVILFALKNSSNFCDELRIHKMITNALIDAAQNGITTFEYYRVTDQIMNYIINFMNDEKISTKIIYPFLNSKEKTTTKVGVNRISKGLPKKVWRNGMMRSRCRRCLHDQCTFQGLCIHSCPTCKDSRASKLSRTSNNDTDKKDHKNDNKPEENKYKGKRKFRSKSNHDRNRNKKFRSN